jgi:EAL domain-containing protein (putative c-di-GMP-specific phosphodiesterase class I)/GGDEF domain-containing protein
MNESNDILRIGLASASLGTIGYPVLNGVFTGSLLLSYLLPTKSCQSDLDQITGLLDLDGFKKCMNELMLKNTNQPDETRKVFIASIDILGFSNLNRKHGYAFGRRCTRTIARTIEKDTATLFACRPYGDVFLLAYMCAEQTEALRKLHNLTVEVESIDFGIGGQVSVCAGLSLPVIDEASDIEIDVTTNGISQAEVSRLIGKRSGQVVNIYKREYASRQLEKIKLEDALIRSIDDKQISVFYQPKISCQNNSIAGYEALCRWYHPELGYISPAFFIPLAEETGFIHTLGEYVFTEACRTLRDLRDVGVNNRSIAVNVSICQLEYLGGKPLLNMIRSKIEEFSIDASMIEIEITESMAAQDFSLIKSHVDTMKEMGLIVSLDDFGTGESSLYRLKELNLDQLKIDKSFVDDVCTPKGKEILEGVFHIASALELSTVAEGVEDAQQREILESMGCTYLQGYLLGKPMPKDTLLGN